MGPLDRAAFTTEARLPATFFARAPAAPCKGGQGTVFTGRAAWRKAENACSLRELCSRKTGQKRTSPGFLIFFFQRSAACICGGAGGQAMRWHQQARSAKAAAV